MINAAYLFYYAPKGLGKDPERNQAIVNDALIMAQSLGFDVMNCLDLLSNSTFLNELKFGRGDGELHYYMYSWHHLIIVGSIIDVEMSSLLKLRWLCSEI